MNGFKKQRNISFEVVCKKIENGDVLEILENPGSKYPHQGVFVISVNDYTWLVPFVDDGNDIKLITAYPSRKAHKMYGGKSDG
jgi:hypothetical protein